MAKVTRGSDNVFVDLGFADAQELQARAELTRRINNVLKHKGLTQQETAKLLGIKQPEVSSLIHGKYIKKFSTDRLFRFLNALGQDVQITIRKKPNARAEARVIVNAGA